MDRFMMKQGKTDGALTVIGWHECISLPELGLKDFAVKVDTGAKTTALHADDIETFFKGDIEWVRFRSPRIAGTPARICEFEVFTNRDITNTSGQPQTRIVIRTPMILAGRKWKIDISLTDRGTMRFPLILGRRALRRHNIAVHPGKSYLVSTKPNLEG
ncbi:RimK/LysX family protein [Sulfitobacter sp. F26169L]|uniref:ATP-dependent zinc protease family protein n=1 Tax=Sulfitobacter sp. F26169L TaxID=2996015 RepID=UPI002260CA6A|nr:RimK/LysX family protein [Sulfitobacter sp. F26169L]MCX7565068.1 RimK/LysX family protein [Sulfitobacter sp. F26169L]